MVCRACYSHCVEHQFGFDTTLSQTPRDMNQNHNYNWNPHEHTMIPCFFLRLSMLIMLHKCGLPPTVAANNRRLKSEEVLPSSGPLRNSSGKCTRPGEKKTNEVEEWSEWFNKGRERLDWWNWLLTRFWIWLSNQIISLLDDGPIKWFVMFLHYDSHPVELARWREKMNSTHLACCDHEIANGPTRSNSHATPRGVFQLRVG